MSPLPVPRGVPDDSGLEIGFTEVLYGVVVANAIYQIEFGLTVRNWMLILALGFILGDWIEYQSAVRDAPETTGNYVTAFVLDVVILIVWYLMTILASAELGWFLGIGAVFFFLQAVWDVLILQYGLRRVVGKPHAQLMLFFIFLAGVQAVVMVSPVVVLALATTGFLVRKAPEWQKLVTQSPEAL